MTTNDKHPKQQVGYSVAMLRLVYLAIIGCLIIVGYGFGLGHSTIVAVGLISAGAALLAGGLLGFLFGVPHVRDGNEPGPETPSGGSKLEASVSAVSPPPAISYRPSTSLEQISDWLTKMLVGVGLIEIRSIAEKVWQMATFIQKAMDGAVGADAFAVSLLVYFFICGFIFGFLWARLYLVQWFREVDQVRALGEKVTELERKQLADAKALSLINHQLNRTADDPPVATEQEVIEAVKAATRPVKAQLFYQAQKVSENSGVEDYDLKLQGVISTLKGLIASDSSERYFDSRAELSYALSRKKPPDLNEAEQFISKAIDIRDRQGSKGWKYFEIRRGRYRIQRDPNFLKKQQSENANLELILADLRVARSQREKWDRWLEDEVDVKQWLQINKIDSDSLANPAVSR